MSILSRDDVHLLDYLRIVYKRRFFFAVVMLAALGGAAWSTSRQSPVYRATSRILIDNQTTLIDFPGVQQWNRAALGTEVHIMRSREVAEHAVKNYLAPELSRNEPEFEALVRTLRARSAVDVLPNTLIVELRVEAEDPEIARQRCEALAESYVEQNFMARKEVNSAGSAAIRQEIDKNQQELSLSERQLMDFKAAYNVIADWQKKLEHEKKFGGSTAAKIDASMKAIDAGGKYRALKRWYDNNQYNLPLPEDLAPSPLITSLYKDIVEKKTDLRNLKSKYREAHPKIQEVIAELRTLEANLDREIQASLAVLKGQSEIYENIGKAHSDQIKEERRTALEDSEREFQYRVLQRAVDVKLEINRALLGKLGELNVADSILRNNVRLIERAKAFPFPVRPNWRLNLLVGLAFGLAVAVAGVFFLEYLDNTLKTPDDIARFLELPVLAVVPIARKELLRSPYEAPQLEQGEAGASAA